MYPWTFETKSAGKHALKIYLVERKESKNLTNLESIIMAQYIWLDFTANDKIVLYMYSSNLYINYTENALNVFLYEMYIQQKGFLKWTVSTG